MELKDVLLSNYLPYAKGTIVSRAIPGIDGLKPAHRRILYTMYTMGLLNKDKIKSSNIVGQTMKIHPHGDFAIYETMVRMSTGNEALNVPYVESKGNFGKTYSKDLAFAAPRYTEAKLTKVCKEVFDGIDEDAVVMQDNFDQTMLEPTLLPVKFPTILVNPTNGIAVGMSSSIPSFSLTNTCKATIGMVKGEITNAEQLMDVLGVPEYTTGGYIHTSKEELIKLGETGRAQFKFSGTVTTYPNRIEIHEIPYNTTAEDIISSIEELAKKGELKEVTEVSDEIDLKGFKIVVYLKSKSNSRAVLQKLVRMTPIRKSISYNTRVVINNRCETIGLYDLLWKWIEFRLDCINRIYTHRKNGAEVQEHLLSAWEKIQNDIKEVAKMIVSLPENEVCEKLKEQYDLDDKQVNYIMDIKVRLFTKDNLAKKLNELQVKRDLIKECTKVLGSDQEKYKIIINDLERIIKEYGKENKTHQADPVVETAEPIEEDKVDDSVVTVILTKSGYLKRLAIFRDISNYSLPEGEEVDKRWTCRNNEYILVFTYSGTVYKILVNDINAGRGQLKDEVYKLIGLPDSKDIMLIDTSEDYNKHFNLVYPNGRGVRVSYARASGKRAKYKGLFEPCEPGKCWITFSDRFFMITQKRKASYCNLELMKLSSRVAFKVARVNSGDKIVALHPEELVPNIESIDLDKYRKDYTVCINDDILWEGAEKSNPKRKNLADEEDTPVEENN